MLLRYYPMSESVQRDDQWSSLHDMVYFRYDEQRPALRAGGLRISRVIPSFLLSVFIVFLGTTLPLLYNCHANENQSHSKLYQIQKPANPCVMLFA
jgi:hypothetical protein